MRSYTVPSVVGLVSKGGGFGFVWSNLSEKRASMAPT